MMKPEDEALFEAIRNTDAAAAQTALERGASVDALSDSFGRTPLYNAVGFESAEIVELLLRHGADPNDGLPPVAMKGNPEIAKLLIPTDA